MKEMFTIVLDDKEEHEFGCPSTESEAADEFWVWVKSYPGRSVKLYRSRGLELVGPPVLSSKSLSQDILDLEDAHELSQYVADVIQSDSSFGIRSSEIKFFGQALIAAAEGRFADAKVLVQRGVNARYD